jgi:hypothetical protein
MFLVFFRIKQNTFDIIEHPVILEILKQKGFGPKWILWMNMIMNSVTSAILLNGGAIENISLLEKGQAGGPALAAHVRPCSRSSPIHI